MTAWTYLAFRDMARWVSAVIAAVVFVIGCTLTLRYNYVLDERAKAPAPHAEGSLE
jgi:hypothetical protein